MTKNSWPENFDPPTLGPMARSNDPLSGLGGRVARNVTSRLV